jgi:translation initiation factor IF-3
MSDHYKGRSKKNFGPRKNQYIRVPKVQLITEKGENEGEVATEKALTMAQAAGLDLVEVGPKAKPPVCKIMDYSKYLYEQKKKARKNKSRKTKPLKEFKFSPVIDIGDKETRIRRAKEFLDKGHPVKLTMWIKGRQSRDQAREVFKEILTNFTDYSSIEAEPRYEARQIFIIFRLDGKAKDKQNSKKKIQADKPKKQKDG